MENQIQQFFNQKSEIQPLKVVWNDCAIEFFAVREDLLHKEVSGNKFRKLKHYLLEYDQGNYEGIISFGGAYSNHIAALAEVGKLFSIPTVAFIRGEALSVYNPTLQRAKECGMQLIFVSRDAYRERSDMDAFKQQYAEFENYLWVPEGGAGKKGELGVKEAFAAMELPNGYVAVACGTGSTLSGMMQANALPHYLGYQVVKDDDVKRRLWRSTLLHVTELTLKDASWGGYAKTSPDLFAFIQSVYQQTGMLTDPIYTGKALYQLIQDACDGKFDPDLPLYFIHTGGIQGWNGFPGVCEKILKSVAV